MNIIRTLRGFFHRPGRAERQAARPPTPPPHAPGTRGGPQAHAAPPPTRPIPIGGQRPEGPPLPLPAYLRPRSDSPGRGNPMDSQTSLGTPPSYHSYVPPHHVGAASPPPPATPPPVFQRIPRFDEQQLAISDLGDRLGMPPSRPGTPGSLAPDRGSLNVHIPRSDADDRSDFSFTSSMLGNVGHDGVSEREMPSPGVTGSQGPVTGQGSRFREHFSDTPPPQ